MQTRTHAGGPGPDPAEMKPFRVIPLTTVITVSTTILVALSGVAWSAIQGQTRYNERQQVQQQYMTEKLIELAGEVKATNGQMSIKGNIDAEQAVQIVELKRRVDRLEMR